MKKLLKKTLFFSLAFGGVIYFLPGFKFNSLQTLITACLFFGLISALLKPIISTFLAPFNFLTFGLINSLINIAFIYAVSIFIPDLKITGFFFSGANYFGFILPSLWISAFFTILISAFLINLTNSFINWFLE